MPGSARSVFCLVVVKANRRQNFYDVERLVAQNRAGQFLAGDVTLAQNHVSVGPVVAVELLRRVRVRFGDDENSDAGAFGDLVLCERYIAGKELTCAVLGDEALDVIEIVSAVTFYNYEAKYAPGGSRHLLPAPLSPNVYQQVRRLALQAHRALGCRGVSRTDFRYDDRMEGTQGLVCLEVNTQPGMTETSLVPELAAYVGMGFEELVRWMVEDASLNR